MFQRIGLITKPQNTPMVDTLADIMNTCQHIPGVQVVMEHQTALSVPEAIRPMAIKAHQLSQYCDLLIVVGGDGSLLSAAHIAVQQQLPVLGINRGTLGFLTDIRPDQLDQIRSIIQGEYQEEHRFLLTAQVEQDGQCLGKGMALNDVVLLRKEPLCMIHFDVYVDHQFVYTQRADGLIVSTPTGSTAYALSAGGPILHPKLDALLLIAMFSHTLSTRPLVVAGNSTIQIQLTPSHQAVLGVSCDGGTSLSIPSNGSITIQKHHQPLMLIHPKNYQYFDTLRNKLHWGHPAT